MFEVLFLEMEDCPLYLEGLRNKEIIHSKRFLLLQISKEDLGLRCKLLVSKVKNQFILGSSLHQNFLSLPILKYCSMCRCCRTGMVYNFKEKLFRMRKESMSLKTLSREKEEARLMMYRFREFIRNNQSNLLKFSRTV